MSAMFRVNPWLIEMLQILESTTRCQKKIQDAQA